jgi:hypothetical protein
MFSKLSKKQLINDINIFFLKQGKICEGNIYKISKRKLIEIMIENEIPHIDNDKLKSEIEETEKFNYYIEIIYYNFMKYKNIDIDIIKNIHNNPNINSNDLNNIIINNNLRMDGFIKETKVLIDDLYNSIDKYYKSTGTKNIIQFKTIPDLIQNLNLL